MTYFFRPGATVVASADLARVYQPGAAVAVLPWWNPDGETPAAVCGAWQAKGAASLAASYLNLATLGNANIDPAIVGGVAPGWNVAFGWIFNNVEYLKTNCIPLLSWSILVQYSSLSNGAFTIAGCFDALTQAFLIQPSFAGNVSAYNGAAQNTAPVLVSGNYAISGKSAYRNGIFDAIIPAGGTDTTIEIYLGGLNFLGAPIQLIKASLSAVAIYSVTLTAAQVLARYNAMAAL